MGKKQKKVQRKNEIQKAEIFLLQNLTASEQQRSQITNESDFNQELNFGDTSCVSIQLHIDSICNHIIYTQMLLYQQRQKNTFLYMTRKTFGVKKGKKRKRVLVAVRNRQQSNSLCTFPWRDLYHRLSAPSSLHQDSCVSVSLFCPTFLALWIAPCLVCVCSHRCRYKIQIYNFFFLQDSLLSFWPLLMQCIEVSFRKGQGRLRFFELQLIPGSQP